MERITIREALQAFGLSDKEIKIYLASLELGTATANEISNKADLNRSTTYDLLKSFLEKGIASKVIKNKTTNFEVAAPEKLIAQLEERKVKLKSVLDELKLLEQQVVKKPTIEAYEGHAGIKTILEDILLTKKRTDVISTSKIFDAFIHFFPQYIRRRKELGIFSRVIQEESSETLQLKKNDKKDNRKTKVLKNFNINSATFIYGEKVAVIKLIKNDLIAVLITDEIVAEDQRSIFEKLWQIAK